MAKSKVFPGSVGAEVIRGLFRDVRAQCDPAVPASKIRVYSGAMVGAEGGEDVLKLAADVLIDGAVVGANGIDTGALASAWYSIWLIKIPGGAVAGLLSLSFSAPTMPSGYTLKRRIGSVYYDTTAFRLFFQNGAHTSYSEEVTAYSGALAVDTAYHAVDLGAGLQVPLTAREVLLQVWGPFTDARIFMSADGVGGHYATSAGGDGTDRQSGDGHVRLVLKPSVASPSVWYKMTPSHSGNSLDLFVSGYVDGLL